MTEAVRKYWMVFIPPIPRVKLVEIWGNTDQRTKVVIIKKRLILEKNQKKAKN